MYAGLQDSRVLELLIIFGEFPIEYQEWQTTREVVMSRSTWYVRKIDDDLIVTQTRLPEFQTVLTPSGAPRNQSVAPPCIVTVHKSVTPPGGGVENENRMSEGKKTVEYLPLSKDVTEDLDMVSFYHPSINRHVAESLLLQNGQDGTYLIRHSSKEGSMALSVRAQDSVKHFPVNWDGSTFHFGLETFTSLDNLIRHFLSKPVLGSEAGTLTGLKHPYPRDVAEPELYETVRVHAIDRSMSLDEDEDGPDFTVASKEGFLTKQGALVKSWKVRWFTLQRNELRYYRCRSDKEPIRVLDLLECVQCAKDFDHDKDFCFLLEFPDRTFYMFANSKDEMTGWVKLIRWKLRHKQQLAQACEEAKKVSLRLKAGQESKTWPRDESKASERTASCDLTTSM